jgi:hypothetical protein
LRSVLAIGAALAAFAASPAVAGARETALAGAFHHWCLGVAPSFQALDAAATAAKLTVEKDTKTNTPGEGQMESKLWAVASEPTGTYDLTGGIAVRNGKTVTICGLAAQDANGEAMLGLLSQPSEFGAPVDSRNTEDGGERLSQFKAPFAHALILLSDGTPQNAAGVILNLTEVREPGR